MVDNVNPNTQFHPYVPQTAKPQTGEKNLNTQTSGLGGILGKLGLNQSSLSGGLGRVRGVARNNSGMVLGGLAALAIGAGLMRRRSAMRTHI